ncbi:MAG TPA: hypothetical protein VFR24_26160 [Candidatus Angelobacter sp.]|nr:hypothetical protein [Candidatus Angelobacter sp.]
MPEYAKDVMLGLLGASVGLAGLLLIFSGFLFAQADSFPKATTDDSIINKYRNVGRAAVAPFLLALIVSGLTLAWMIHPNHCTYWVAIWFFAILLVVSAGYGGFVLIWYL